MSGSLPVGPFAASPTIRSATSPVSIGWNLSAFGTSTSKGTRANSRRKPPISVWTCVARREALHKFRAEFPGPAGYQDYGHSSLLVTTPKGLIRRHYAKAHSLVHWLTQL